VCARVLCHYPPSPPSSGRPPPHHSALLSQPLIARPRYNDTIIISLIIRIDVCYFPLFAPRRRDDFHWSRRGEKDLPPARRICTSGINFGGENMIVTTPFVIDNDVSMGVRRVEGQDGAFAPSPLEFGIKKI